MKHDTPRDPAELRRLAEERLSGKQGRQKSEVRGQKSEVRGQRSAEDSAHLVQELQVHQIELEIQNEELQRTRAQAEALLAQYTDLYDFAPVGYLTLSEQDLILKANLNGAKLLGVARSALLKQPLSRFILKADHDLYHGQRQLLFELGDPRTCELRLVGKDGTTRCTHLAMIVARDPGGTAVCRMILSDISRPKQAEEALQRANDELERHVLERTGELGRANEELKTEIAERKQAEERARAAQAETQRLLALSDQSRRTLLSVAEDEHVASEALRESETRYRTLFEDARDGMALADAETGLLVDCNLALCVMVERDKAELVGRPEAILHPPETESGRVSRTFRQHQSEDSGKALKDRLISKSGTLTPVDIRVAHIRMHGRDYLLEVFRDTTERERAEDALRRSAVELHSLAAHLNVVREEERAALARVLHDDFGQNLTALQIDLGWLDGHLRGSQPLDMARVQDRIAAMTPLLEHLTERTQTVCAALRPGMLDDLGLSAAIEWQAEECQKRTGLTCVVSTSATDVEVERDHALALFRVFQEALTNVVRHAKATRVDVGLHEVNGELELEVRDNGQGFVLESFTGAKALGLLGMRERVLAFEGMVDIFSEPGRGTTVRVQMPAA
jgi:PAS domain S-box-containing protein